MKRSIPLVMNETRNVVLQYIGAMIMGIIFAWLTVQFLTGCGGGNPDAPALDVKPATCSASHTNDCPKTEGP